MNVIESARYAEPDRYDLVIATYTDGREAMMEADSDVEGGMVEFKARGGQISPFDPADTPQISYGRRVFSPNDR